MILADTSVWVDHLRVGVPALAQLLDRGAILTHDWVIGEVALGNLSDRSQVIGLLRGLPAAAPASAVEVMTLIEQGRLHGLGIGYADAQLLAATRLTRGARLWTSDRRLAAAASHLGNAFEPACSSDAGAQSDQTSGG